MKKTSMIAIVMAILLPFSADITTNNTADAVPLNAKIGIKPDKMTFWVGEKVPFFFNTLGAQMITISLEGLEFDKERLAKPCDIKKIAQNEQVKKCDTVGENKDKKKMYIVLENTVNKLVLKSAPGRFPVDQILTLDHMVAIKEGSMKISVTVEIRGEKKSDVAIFTGIPKPSETPEDTSSDEEPTESPTVSEIAPWLLTTEDEYGRKIWKNSINPWNNTFRGQLWVPVTDTIHFIGGVAVAAGDKNPFYFTSHMWDDAKMIGATVIPMVGGSYTTDDFLLKIMIGANLYAERIKRWKEMPINLELENRWTFNNPVVPATLLTEISSQLNNIQGTNALLLRLPFGESKTATVRLGGSVHYSVSKGYRFFDGGPIITGNFFDDFLQLKLEGLVNSAEIRGKITFQFSSKKSE